MKPGEDEKVKIKIEIKELPARERETEKIDAHARIIRIFPQMTAMSLPQTWDVASLSS